MYLNLNPSAHNSERLISHVKTYLSKDSKTEGQAAVDYSKERINGNLKCRNFRNDAHIAPTLTFNMVTEKGDKFVKKKVVDFQSSYIFFILVSTLLSCVMLIV